MYGSRYVWILLGMYDEHWWLAKRSDLSCTTAQLAQAVSGYWSVNSLSTLSAGQRSVSGMTSDDFLREYEALDKPAPLSSFARLAYDSMWTVAMTLRATQQRLRHVTGDTGTAFDSFGYQTRSGHAMRNTFLDVMGNLEFMGISGPVSFDGSDRRCISVLAQHQDGKQVPIAFYFPENNSLSFNCIGCKPVVWKDGKIPHDKYTIESVLMNLDHDAFIIVSSISVAGIALAFFFLGFSLHNRKLKYIKLSSPTLNNVAVVGCILIYVSVIFLGFDDATIHRRYFATICMVGRGKSVNAEHNTSV
ncbi:Gamma-aminobutyric acid type B receptor subunit 1 [Lamellibrachia satsuma]|nr:Gamma-aminobutyric acid type B receptor subunit 1 [Lamellibrachia satsuma]